MMLERYGFTNVQSCNSMSESGGHEELEKVLTQFEVDRDELNKLEDMLISAMKEGDGRKKGIHGKGHPMRKKQQAAIHAGESTKKNDTLSIKEQLMKALNDYK